MPHADCGKGAAGLRSLKVVDVKRGGLLLADTAGITRKELGELTVKLDGGDLF